MKNYIIVSYFGLQKRKVSSRRIYSLAKSLKENGNRVFFVTIGLDYPETEKYDYSFADKVIYLDVKKAHLLNFMFKYYRKNMMGNTIEANNNAASVPETANNNKKAKVSFKNKIKSHIRNNYFSYNRLYDAIYDCYMKVIPEDFLKAFEKNIDKEIINSENTVLITSSAPAIIHETGKLIKNKYKNIFWVADYRDPISNNIYSTSYSKKLENIELDVFRHADMITSVSSGVTENLTETAKSYGFNIVPRAHTLFNGFLKSDIRDKSKNNSSRIFNDKRKTILYTGIIYPLRKIDILARALAESDSGEKFYLAYAGDSQQLIKDITTTYNLENHLMNLGYLTHDEAKQAQEESDILLLLKSPEKESGTLTGKFFEYLETDKPILVLGDKDEEFNEIVKDIPGIFVLPYEKDKIENFLKNIDTFSYNRKDKIDIFSWEYLADKLDKKIGELK